MRYATIAPLLTGFVSYCIGYATAWYSRRRRAQAAVVEKDQQAATLGWLFADFWRAECFRLAAQLKQKKESL